MPELFVLVPFGSRPVGISYRRHAADGREHDYEHLFAWLGGNVSEESIREDGTEVQLGMDKPKLVVSPILLFFRMHVIFFPFLRLMGV